MLSAHTSGIANSAISFSGEVVILNNKESHNIFLSVNISTFQIAVFVLCNLFWAKYKYPACISFTVTGKCAPLRTFLWITFNILSMLTCLGMNFCTSLSVLIRLSNSSGLCKK